MSESPDRSTLRKASLRVAVRVSAACAVMVLCFLAAGVLYLLYRAGHPHVPGTGEPGSVYVYLDSTDMIAGMIVAGAAGIVLAGGAGWLSARSAIRPLGEALALQRRFVQDASHELRTPLAILDARIQLAQREAAADSGAGQALARIRQDTSALTAIVNELLLAAMGSRPDPAAEPTDMARVAGEVAESLQQIAREKDISVVFSADGSPQARIGTNSVRRAILALADNALAHTPAGGQITIATAVQKGHAVITVADTGTGITGVDGDRIFERFVHTDGKETQRRRSFGIGLALVREITTAAGGTVEIASTGHHGTVMKITLPLAGG
ncbi:sensor histidine kinase [Pseudarthrobacter sp. P1]|uniref:sensor histidine kinase n=1 Tax=Pseudarthrobacter sp. P1 TaxID=3418418 RepID=UPI003CF619EA